MADQNNLEWKGLGRWLSFTVAGLFILLAIPSLLVPSEAQGVAGFLNIFLGLLLFGTVVSGHRKAPLLALILTALMLVRVVTGLVAGLHGLHAIDTFLNLILLVLVAAAAFDLRRQAASA